MRRDRRDRVCRTGRQREDVEAVGGDRGDAGLRPRGRGGRGELEAGGKRRTFDPKKRS